MQSQRLREMQKQTDPAHHCPGWHPAGAVGFPGPSVWNPIGHAGKRAFSSFLPHGTLVALGPKTGGRSKQQGQKNLSQKVSQHPRLIQAEF